MTARHRGGTMPAGQSVTLNDAVTSTDRDHRQRSLRQHCGLVVPAATTSPATEYVLQPAGIVETALVLLESTAEARPGDSARSDRATTTAGRLTRNSGDDIATPTPPAPIRPCRRASHFCSRRDRHPARHNRP